MDHSYPKQSLEDAKIDEDVFEDEKTTDADLIDYVRNYPHLYDKQNKGFKEPSVKDNSWQEIANLLDIPGMSANECKRRWTRLRERYSREKKARTKESKSGSGSSQRKGFALFQNMQFMDQHIVCRRSYSNVDSHISKKAKHCNDSDGAENTHPVTPDTSDTAVQSDVMIDQSFNDPFEFPEVFLQDGQVPLEEKTAQVPNPSTSVQSTKLNDLNVLCKNGTKNPSKPDSNLGEKKSPLTAISPNRMETKINDTRFKKPGACKKKNETTKVEDVLENSFIQLSNVMVQKLEQNNEIGMNQNSNMSDPDVTFANFLISELKVLPETVKHDKKQKIVAIIYS